jgi:hypothetical protein
MGLLDDAIREHLDLKRRRGADPAEIERAEREALGPVRRNREPGLSEEPDATDGTEFDPAPGSARDEPDEGTASDLIAESYRQGSYGEDERGMFVADEGYLDAEEPSEEELVAPRDAPSTRAREPVAEEDDPHRTQLMSTVDVAAEPPSSNAPTLEHAVAEPPAADEPFGEDEPFAEEAPSHPASSDEEDDDMLGETPEFLQDTPDHDRLWFEQRPPRDFDFEG